MQSGTGFRLTLLASGAVTIGCDRVSKHLASEALAGNAARSYLADAVRISYVENPGGFLSIGADLPPTVRMVLFTVGAGVALLALATLALRSRSRWLALGLTLLLSGGASNWVDRVTRGSVVDFLNVGIGPVRTGVFNLADVAIVCGVGILVLSEVRRIGNAPVRRDSPDVSGPSLHGSDTSDDRD